MFVVLRRHGPDWDPRLPMEEQSGWDDHAAYMDALTAEGFIVLGGPLEDEVRVVLAVDSDSMDEVRRRLAEDPWSPSHLVVDSIQRWTLRLDGRRR